MVVCVSVWFFVVSKLLFVVMCNFLLFYMILCGFVLLFVVVYVFV